MRLLLLLLILCNIAYNHSLVWDLPQATGVPGAQDVRQVWGLPVPGHRGEHVDWLAADDWGELSQREPLPQLHPRSWCPQRLRLFPGVWENQGRSPAGWLAGWLIWWWVSWLTDWLTDWLAGWLTDWLTESLTHSFTHSLTHSLTDWFLNYTLSCFLEVWEPR